MRLPVLVAGLLAAGAGPSAAVQDPSPLRLQLHWALQTDLQTFVGEPPAGVAARDAFLVRFAGVQLDAALGERVRSQLFVDFSASRLTLYDAWVEAAAGDGLKLRAGKFQLPISEERLTPGIALPFVSTGFASVALPARDTGLQLHGKRWGGGLAWNLALVNGTAPGTLGEADADGAKDVVVRVFVRPFQATALAPLRRLGLGVGASRGWRTGTVDAPLLPVLRTYGGQTYFSYRYDRTPAGTAVADGPVTRLVPHATWGWGPVAAYADWAHVEERVRGATVTTDAVSVVPSIVLTGEEAQPLAFVVPRRPFDLEAGSIGTVLLVLGAGRMRVSDAAFTSGAADPAAAMQVATVIGGGLNWYPMAGVALLTSFGHMTFEGHRGAPARRAEDALVCRFQLVL